MVSDMESSLSQRRPLMRAYGSGGALSRFRPGLAVLVERTVEEQGVSDATLQVGKGVGYLRSRPVSFDGVRRSSIPVPGIGHPPASTRRQRLVHQPPHHRHQLSQPRTLPVHPVLRAVRQVQPRPPQEEHLSSTLVLACLRQGAERVGVGGYRRQASLHRVAGVACPLSRLYGNRPLGLTRSGKIDEGQLALLACRLPAEGAS